MQLAKRTAGQELRGHAAQIAFHPVFSALHCRHCELEEQFMRTLGYSFALVLALLISGTASAQEGKGWLGADVLDITKAEADKLGWDSPHGAKLGVVALGSPADKAGLKTGDIILAIDTMFIETGSNVDALLALFCPVMFGIYMLACWRGAPC